MKNVPPVLGIPLPRQDQSGQPPQARLGAPISSFEPPPPLHRQPLRPWPRFRHLTFDAPESARVRRRLELLSGVGSAAGAARLPEREDRLAAAARGLLLTRFRGFRGDGGAALARCGTSRSVSPVRS
jgi:hypothetical protein